MTRDYSLHSVLNAFKNLEKVVREGQNGMKEEISKINSAMENFPWKSRRRHTKCDKTMEDLQNATLQLERYSSPVLWNL